MDTVQVQVVDTVYFLNSGYMDLITTMATIVIAVIALYFSIWQGKKIRRHNRLSVKPHIDIHVSDKPNIIIENNGVGPAIIKSYKIYLNDMELPKSIKREELMPLGKKLGFKELPFQHKYYNKGNYVKPGESIIALAEIPKLPLSAGEMNKSRSILQKAKVRIVYESIYGEKFPPAKLN